MRLSHSKGIKGENKACQYLIKRKWRIIERNWHCRWGEIDIIASKEDCLVFFEVKLRSSDSFGGVLASISPQKIDKIKKSVYSYLQHHPSNLSIRVDALLIEDSQPISIQHIVNITDS